MVQGGLALGLIPGVGWRAAEIRRVAREAEEAGFAAVFAAEVNNDVLATVQLMGEATQRIQVGSWVANIYLRHPYVCAQAAALIADATGGRMVLGLGVSHQPVNSALDVVMGSPIGALRDYSIAVASWLRGEGPATHLPQRPATHPVPIYLGALTSPTVELAGEMADGIMPVWWSPERVAHSRVWADRGRARSAVRSKLQVALGLPTFVGDDVATLRARARANLGLPQPTVFPAAAAGERLCCRSGSRRARWRRGGSQRSCSRRYLFDGPVVALPPAARGIPRRRDRSADLMAGGRRRERAGDGRSVSPMRARPPDPSPHSSRVCTITSRPRASWRRRAGGHGHDRGVSLPWALVDADTQNQRSCTYKLYSLLSCLRSDSNCCAIEYV